MRSSPPVNSCHGRNVHELFISSKSRVVRIHNLCVDAAPVIASVLHANHVMLPISAWSLHEQFGGAPKGHEFSIWCVFRTHDDACRALRLDGTNGISVSTALEHDLKPFSKLRRFDLQDDVDSSLNINFNLAPLVRTSSPGSASNPVLYSTNEATQQDDIYTSKNTGYLTPPTPTTALSSCGSSSEGTSPPSSTLSLFGGRANYNPSTGFTMSTNPPSPRNAFKRGDWMCPNPGCTTHNFGRNTVCIACCAPRPLDLSLPAKPPSDYDRYFDQRAPLPLSPPPPRRANPLSLSLSTGTGAPAIFSPTLSTPTTFASTQRAHQPPRLPSILTPSGRALAQGGRIQNVSPLPTVPLVMFWPDNEPLPLPSQIRPPFAPGQHPPIMNTGNRGPVEHQPGDWYCGKCSYMNWRRRKVCQTCFPFAEGNADGVSAAVQAERINALMQLAGSTLATLQPGKQDSTPTSFDSNFGPGLDAQAPVQPRTLGLGLNLHPGVGHHAPTHTGLDPLGPMMTSFGSMNLSDRRASIGHAFGRTTPVRGSLRTRPSDAALRSSGAAGVPMRAVRGPDAALARLPDPAFTSRVAETGYPSLGSEASYAPIGSEVPCASRPSDARASDGQARSTLDAPTLTFGLASLGSRRVSAGNIWATGDGQTSQGLWPTYDLKI